jgi:hypothetical protein
MGDERGIGPVRFGARQSALGIGRDARRVDEADTVAGLIEEQGHGRPVLPGGFQAGMDLLSPLMVHPTDECSEPSGLHGEGASGELSWQE